MTTTLFLNSLAFGTLLTSVFTITSINPVISVILLIATFVQASLYLIFIGINFVGISYIIVYVGAIAVLFLFVIMMIDINISELQETGDQFTKNIPLAICIVVLFIFIFFNIVPLFINLPINSSLFIEINSGYLNNIDSLLLAFASGAGQGGQQYIPQENLILALDLYSKNINLTSDITLTSMTQITSLGHSLYINDAVLLITLSVILLLAMFATIIISRTRNK
uniref:NADH-ubiquinone oxidoreductase chain 6 n=1 Tax=Blastosporella zonata TaxID=530045 RepID=A0A386TY37_9AGAR|nr:NADH dehydrogenase subunit 6 [Blastosporella zonata]AYE93112.1 NADH dehydrogenase subunit 6 [Blastosporella zonata]